MKQTLVIDGRKTTDVKKELEAPMQRFAPDAWRQAFEPFPTIDFHPSWICNERRHKIFDLHQFRRQISSTGAIDIEFIANDEEDLPREILAENRDMRLRIGQVLSQGFPNQIMDCNHLVHLLMGQDFEARLSGSPYLDNWNFQPVGSIEALPPGSAFLMIDHLGAVIHAGVTLGHGIVISKSGANPYSPILIQSEEDMCKFYRDKFPVIRYTRISPK